MSVSSSRAHSYYGARYSDGKGGPFTQKSQLKFSKPNVYNQL